MGKVRIAVLIVAALAFSLAGCTAPESAPDQPEASTPVVAESPTPEPTVSIDPSLLCHTKIDMYTSVTGTTLIDHPAWGPTTIVVCGPTDTPIQDAGILAVDSTGSARWSTESSDNHVTYKLADPATDASGNIFIVYNPGRYDGVMILHPTSESIEVLADSYASYQEQASPLFFYYAKLVGPGTDGLYQIEQFDNDCVPSCAEASPTSSMYAWNGTTYVEQ